MVEEPYILSRYYNRLYTVSRKTRHLIFDLEMFVHTVYKDFPYRLKSVTIHSYLVKRQNYNIIAADFSGVFAARPQNEFTGQFCGHVIAQI